VSTVVPLKLILPYGALGPYHHRSPEETASLLPIIDGTHVTCGPATAGDHNNQQDKGGRGTANSYELLHHGAPAKPTGRGPGGGDTALEQAGSHANLPNEQLDYSVPNDIGNHPARSRGACQRELKTSAAPAPCTGLHACMAGPVGSQYRIRARLAKHVRTYVLLHHSYRQQGTGHNATAASPRASRELRRSQEAAKIGVPVRISPNAQHGDIISPKAQTYPPFPRQSGMARAVADTDNWTAPYGPRRPACCVRVRPACPPRQAFFFPLRGRCSTLTIDRWGTVTPGPTSQRVCSAVDFGTRCTKSFVASGSGYGIFQASGRAACFLTVA